MSLDMAQLESRTAVEFDGPTHYFMVAGAPPQPDGKTTLKRRLLTKLGWRLFSAPYFEWGPLRSAVERQEYLARLLAAGPL